MKQEVHAQPWSQGYLSIDGEREKHNATVLKDIIDMSIRLVGIMTMAIELPPDLTCKASYENGL